MEIKVISEIASAHEGDTVKLRELIFSAVSSDADFIKLQIFNFNELVASDNKVFSILKKVELGSFEWISVLDYAYSIGAKIIAEVYDDKSFNLVKGHKSIKGYKIPTSDINNFDLISVISNENLPVFIGTGGATQLEIDKAFNIFKDREPPILIHGIQSFPTKVSDSYLEKISLLRNRYKCEVGYADHVDAEDKYLAFIIPAMAFSRGARYIEKHITLSRENKGLDYYSALNPGEFINFVKIMKQISGSFSDTNSIEFLGKAEIEYREKMKKYAVAKDQIKKGDPLTSECVVFKRTNEPGLSNFEFFNFINKEFNQDVNKNEVISFKHFS